MLLFLIYRYPNITYYVVIKRRPLFFIFNMVFPSILITMVGFLGFVISPETGEKVNMGVTTLLSMVVFLMVFKFFTQYLVFLLNAINSNNIFLI